MKSMTGYGKANYLDDQFEIEIEVKSVNSRFFDFKTRIPRELSFLEFGIKELCAQRIKRGKVEVYINFSDKRVPDIVLDELRFSAFLTVYTRAQELMGGTRELPFSKIIGEPGVITLNTSNLEDSGVVETIMNTLQQAIDRHQQMALHEGGSMHDYMVKAMEDITSSLSRIEAAVPAYRKEIYAKVTNGLADLLPEALSKEDHKRIMMEAAIYIDKSDITEEIVRMKNHVHKYLERIELDDKEMGKSLNFILQEMHREINTTGSKFGATEVFSDVMAIREEIEKCREIVQNVE
jgi:uncharacterized protein (TIGR00255 family)